VSELGDRGPTPFAQPIPADIDQDALEPGLESRWVTQARKRAPCLDHGVVGRVFGVGTVAQDDAGESVCAIEVSIDQLREYGLSIGRGDCGRLAADHQVPPVFMPNLTNRVGESFDGMQDRIATSFSDTRLRLNLICRRNLTPRRVVSSLLLWPRYPEVSPS